MAASLQEVLRSNNAEQQCPGVAAHQMAAVQYDFCRARTLTHQQVLNDLRRADVGDR